LCIRFEINAGGNVVYDGYEFNDLLGHEDMSIYGYWSIIFTKLC
jgi:hypothetical protein